MNSSQKRYEHNSYLTYLPVFWGIFGSLILTFLSFFQKVIADCNVLYFPGYTLPIITGFLFGFITGKYRLKMIYKNRELRKKISMYEGLLPICSHCKRIRLGDGDPSNIKSWEPVEKILINYVPSGLTHGLCPDCLAKYYGEYSSTEEDHLANESTYKERGNESY